MPRRFILTTTYLLAFAAMIATARAEDAAATAAADTFLYPLRAGESVSDVARIFRVPVEDLIALNDIRDANHLQLGQMLRVPNAFAREAAELRAGEQALVAEKAAALRKAHESEQALLQRETQLRQTEAERDAFQRALAATASWQRAATMLLGLLAAAMLWALKSHLEAALAARKERVLAAENASLRVAKERYRLAASQLELRYQKLYGRRREPLSFSIAEGLDRLQRAFGDGASQIERLLGEIKSERAKYTAASETSRARAWLFHPLRELLDRHRLKYHAP
jgi:murein DD-endopeptidase MepM/ murein hydrolase activator NlpD